MAVAARLHLLAIALVTLSGSTSVAQQPPRPSVVRDSTPPDSSRPRAPTRLAVTAELMRTAYRDERARDLIRRARIARLQLDSSLQSYDARVRQRMTARVAVREHGISRVMYRQESAFRVQWLDTIGARVDITGARIGIPLAPESAEKESLEESLTDAGITPIPYIPGQDAMSLGSMRARAEVNDQNGVQPIATGGEAYYVYASGDSMTWTLPDGRRIRLREITIRPRTPKWNLIVGSFWFDDETAQLVRSAYRTAVPTNIWTRMNERARVDGTKENPILEKIAKAFISPLEVEVTGIAIEYGLFEGRYWLPRSRSLTGRQQIAFAHLLFLLEQTFSYDGVNRTTSLPTIAINQPGTTWPEVPDSLTGEALKKWRDSVATARQKLSRTFSDSVRKAPCDSTGRRVAGRLRGDVAVAVSYPCDVASLVMSRDFEKPLYDPGEQVFGTAQLDALMDDALPFGAQALIRLSELPRPAFQYGLSLTRYNRIEGLSTGISASQAIGAGYSATGTVRFGFADREPNAELSVARSSRSQAISLTGYNRLVSANDWGSPLSFGAGVSALLFGRDEGFYYRTNGAELRWISRKDAGTSAFEWRLFGEQQRTALPHAAYSIAGNFGPNIVATTGAFFGTSIRLRRATGLDPRRLRTNSELRLEAATGDSSYGRAAMDFTLSRQFGGWLSNSLTLGAGMSIGQLPPQRRWFLGSTQTVRGFLPDTSRSGDSYWLGRLEVGVGPPVYRALLFGDLGWTGSRRTFTERVLPMSALGVGFSFWDGMLRVDIARGIRPRGQTQIAAYLGGRF